MSLPSVWHSAKPSLPSVDSLPSVLGLALGKGCLCRVSDIWHSAKELALGIVELSGSVMGLGSHGGTLQSRRWV